MAEQAKDKIIDMRRRIDEARRAEESLFSEGGGGDGVDSGFVKQCLFNNERGDGILYSALNQDKYLHIKATGQWLAWAGHHWQLDKADLCHDAVEKVAERYLKESIMLDGQIQQAREDGRKNDEQLAVDLKKLYTRRVERLRGMRGAKACLEWAHKIGDRSLAIVGHELDQKPWLLPCRNGVIDLRTGKLTEGRPDDLLVKAIPVEWQGIDAPRPHWESFIHEIHLGDAEMINFIRRLLGYSITGLTTEHFIACFVGEGRNGKGTMFEALREIMGELAWAIQPELILEQKNTRSSAGPSPDLISLQGRRMVIASETDENRRISGSKIKSLTGGDTINARAPHDRFETNFRPTHTLFLYTNHIPSGLTRDFALYKRLLFINYPLKFVDDPAPDDQNQRKRDPELLKRLAGEASGILAWLVQGCLEWQEYGLTPPERIRADVEKLRVSEDTFQQFFDEQLQKDDDGEVLFKTLYDKFSSWYAEEISDKDKYRPSKKSVSSWLEKAGFERRKPGGKATVYGLSLKGA